MIVKGIGIDERPGCAHWRSERDLIAIQFPCCGEFYACYECHNACTDHTPERWPKARWQDQGTILCRACHKTLSIADYMAADAVCPYCRAAWNPGCKNHWALYFEVENLA